MINCFLHMAFLRGMTALLATLKTPQNTNYKNFSYRHIFAPVLFILFLFIKAL